MSEENPILKIENREPTDWKQGDAFQKNEVQLANRNCGTLAETLSLDITPVGAHYLLNHFDVPLIADQHADAWELEISGLVNKPVTLSLSEIKQLPSKTLPVTFECAGNGRAGMLPRWPSQPWFVEAVGTAYWTGTSLQAVLDLCGVEDTVQDVVFYGADEGVASGERHYYGRGMPLADVWKSDALLVWAMNHQPLLPQHGFPLRLVVPGWYGMGNVKWLNRIELIDHTFDGHQQQAYMIRDEQGNPIEPVSTMQVRALMAPPGIPEWLSARRLIDSGAHTVVGKAWSGSGVPIARVEFCDNHQWRDAELGERLGKYAWTPWSIDWQPSPGKHIIECRATDAEGNVQPEQAPWNARGFCNNATHAVEVWCT
ncbi:MAG: sulfite oxidase [Gammaproteobacteria bacterium]|nr:sulfite oxidase [Gammaproteobacteria bacterium]